MSAETIYSSHDDYAQDDTNRARLLAACDTDAALPVASVRARLARASAPSERLMRVLRRTGV